MSARMTGVTRALMAAAAATVLTLGVSAQVAGAGGPSPGAAPLTVVKTVSGTAPAGTTFAAVVQCDGAIIVDGGEGTYTATVTFGATGQPTSPDTVTFGDPGQCTVTETAAGGAASTTYACEGVAPVDEPDRESFSAQQVLPEDPICPAAGPQASPITVNIEFEGQQASVTIHNTFADPVVRPAASIVAAPAFTG